MKKFSTALLILLIAGLAGTAIAFASTVNRSPDATFPHSPELNHTAYWGDNCRKYVGFEGSVGYMPPGYSLLVLKAGTNNFVWYNPPTGEYGTPDFKDISHSIVCHGVVNKITYETWYEVDCKSVKYMGKVLSNGQVVSGPFLLHTYSWTDPLVIETAPVLTGVFNVGYGQMSFSFDEISEPRDCYETCDVMTDWVAQTPTVRRLPNGDTITSTVFLRFDALDQETVCARRVLLDRDEYEECTEVTVGDWTPYTGSGINKTSFRETIDNFTGEVCNTEYRKKCVGEESVHYWTDGWCSFRDRTYPDNASWMVNPPVFMQNAYCGCGYVPFGEWGIVEVSECDADGYKYWNELTPYCGYESCE